MDETVALPAFLLDMLPQGHARVKLEEILQVNPDTDAISAIPV
jgi:hypothetical protein